MAKKAKKSRAKGANPGALRHAAARAARVQKNNRELNNLLGAVIVRDLVPTLRAVKERPNLRSSPLAQPRTAPEVLKPAPRQKPLVFSPGKAPLRATTKKALQEPRKTTRTPARMSAAMREAICREYKASQKARRGSMFAKGSAGKGRGNPGPRKQDWRAEACR